jgi:hypothetical protein
VWLPDMTTAPRLDADPVIASSHGIDLYSPRGNRATLNHWSLGQLCSLIGTPRPVATDYPASLATPILNFDLARYRADSDNKILTQTHQDGSRTIRAINGPDYSRIWDHELYKAVQERTAGKMAPPPVWEGGTGGLYLSDRDSAICLISGGSIVEDPTAGGGGTLHRGIIIRNSEVGACSLQGYLFLFRTICGNHLILGSTEIHSMRARHVGTQLYLQLSRFMNSAARFIHSDTTATVQQIKTATETELGKSREKVIEELRNLGMTKTAAAAAYDRAEHTEQCSPRSLWGIAQGITRISQDESHGDDRLFLDLMAAKVLRRAQLVAA